MTNTEDGSYATRSVTETVQHMEQLYEDMGPRIKREPRYYRPVIKFFEEIAEVIIEAKRQGPPEARDALDDRIRRRKLQVRF